MIISISGRIGSGKDLVGSIIQYLIWKNKIEKGEKINLHYTFEDFTKSKFGSNNLSGWEIKKFADKLKDIVCLLIGCTREQLEDRVFKETVLGPEWWYYKGEVGIYPYNTPYEANKKLPLIKLTPRMLFQEIGTDLFRNQLHSNVWINATMAEYKPIAGTMDVRRSRETFPNWIITDVRFPNEADAIKEKNGIIIRLQRNTNKVLVNNLDSFINSKGYVPLKEHESETALDNYEGFDYIIDNNGTIEELIVKVREILIKENIL